jgi:GH18 family chitinase
MVHHFLIHFQICLLVKGRDLTQGYDEKAKAVYAYGSDQFVSYDTKQSIIEKVSSP